MSACMAAISETGFLVPVCANAVRAGNRCCLHNENPNPPTRTPKVKSRRLRRAAVFIIRWHLTSISIRKINRQEACREIALNRTRHFIRQNACRQNNQRYTALLPTVVCYDPCSCTPESAIWTSSSHIVCFSCHRHNEFAIRDGPSANRKVPMATSRETGFSKFGKRVFDTPLVPGGRSPLQSFGHSGKARWIEPSASNSGAPRPTPVKNSRNGFR